MKDDGRKLSKKQQAGARRRAMLLLGKGWHESDIAEAVGMHERTVRQWKQHQRDHGTEALLRDERGRQQGEGRNLTAAQEKQIRALIADNPPNRLKLTFDLWTREAVAKLLKQQFGLELPIRTMGLYLKRWGFTPQRPIKKVAEQNSKKVKAWLEQEYPQIAVAAKAERAEIYWSDQNRVNNQPNAPRGYAPRGQTPVIKQMSKRFGSLMMSAVSNRGSARWMVYKGELDADLLIRFLERLVRSMKGRKVYLILDNLRVHHSELVEGWLKAHEAAIAVHHLPSYSHSRRTPQPLAQKHAELGS